MKAQPLFKVLWFATSELCFVAARRGGLCFCFNLSAGPNSWKTIYIKRVCVFVWCGWPMMFLWCTLPPYKTSAKPRFLHTRTFHSLIMFSLVSKYIFILYVRCGIYRLKNILSVCCVCLLTYKLGTCVDTCTRTKSVSCEWCNKEKICMRCARIEFVNCTRRFYVLHSIKFETYTCYTYVIICRIYATLIWILYRYKQHIFVYHRMLIRTYS